MTKMLLATLAVALTLPLAMSAQPAAAQNRDRALVIFGNDPCPADTICVTKPEGERFRIPEELRRTNPTPDDVSWAERSAAAEDLGRTGTDSCSPVGSGGWTGCYAKMLRDARAERRARETGNAPDDR